MTGERRSAKEQNPSIPGDFVPLPSPDDGLAQLIADLSPPAALTFGTPFVRVPVTAPPSFPLADLDAHQELATRRWAAGWTPRERQRVRSVLDADHYSPGGRYLNMSRSYGWLMLALERAHIGWEAALFLAEQLTEPPVDWFTLEQAATNGGSHRPEARWAPRLGIQQRPRERKLTAYRSMALAVYADLGSDRPLWRLGPRPEDENRRPSRLLDGPSRLLDASAACGVIRKPESLALRRGAENARDRGRRLLHSIGAWPWAHYPGGHLEQDWWTAPHVVEELGAWRDIAEAGDDGARRMRASAARRAGL